MSKTGIGIDRSEESDRYDHQYGQYRLHALNIVSMR